MAEEIEKGDEILDSFLARKEVRELSNDTDEVMEEGPRPVIHEFKSN